MLRINDEARNFTAETSQGTINLHEWVGNGSFRGQSRHAASGDGAA